MTGWMINSQDLYPLLPELLLVGGALAVLIVPLFLPRKHILGPAIAAAVALVAALGAVALTRGAAIDTPGPLFGGLLTIDPFGWFARLLLVLFTGFVMALWFTDSHDKFLTRGQAGDTPEFFLLLLSALLGMMLMVSTTNLLMMFVALELASLPSYVLAGFRKTHRVGAEAAMKYVLFGAAAAAIMVYGMSLIYGLFGTLDLQVVGRAVWGPSTLAGARGVAFFIGVAGILAGIGFKIAMVPMHFWCPDVFEGAAIDVTTFLSVASKGAGLAMLMRVLTAMGLGDPQSAGGHWLSIALLVLGIVTCFWGNLAAFSQTNIKRLLAWSSVAHAGYMLIGMSTFTGAEVLLFYLFMYLFMNGGAFVAAAAIAQRLTGPTDPGMSIGVSAMVPSAPGPAIEGSGEELSQYAGLSQRAPVLAAIMLVFLLSLTGIPLTIGFATKIKLFQSLFDSSAGMPHLAAWAGIAAVGINTILGAFYYFRVIRQMYLTGSEAPRLIEIAPVTIVALVLAVPNIAFFIGYGWVEHEARRHAVMWNSAAPANQPSLGGGQVVQKIGKL